MDRALTYLVSALCLICSTTSLSNNNGIDIDLGGLLDSVEGIQTLLKTIGSGGNCEFTCPNGVKPSRKVGYQPTSNGCGSFGVQLDTEDLPAMSVCCNIHDECYDTCNSIKHVCDDQFKACLNRMCNVLKRSKHSKNKEHEGCLMTSGLMHTATIAIGCTAYMTSQENACDCQEQPTKKRQEL